MVNIDGRMWLLKVASAGKWTRIAVMVLVMACVQAVYWGVWLLKAELPQQVTTPTTSTDMEDDGFELSSWITPEQIAAWQMPKDWFDTHGQAQPDRMHGYWEALEKLAATQGLDVHFQVNAHSVDWRLTGDFGAVMAWLHELTDNHPRLVMHRISLSPIDPGTWVKAHIELGVQALGAQGDGPSSAASTPFELAALNSLHWTAPKADAGLTAFDGGAWVSPFGLAPWFNQLADEGWGNDVQSERLTALQLLPLSQMQWVGSLTQGSRAVALLSAGGQIWQVGLGERVGRGLSRVVDIQADRVFIEVLTLDGRGPLQRSEVILGAAGR
jgi:hypothetical protein